METQHPKFEISRLLKLCYYRSSQMQCALDVFVISLIKISPYGVMLILGLFSLLFVLFIAVKTDSKLTLHHMGNFI